jgi:hypothetical protein
MCTSMFTRELNIGSDRQSLSTPVHSMQQQNGVQQKNVYGIRSDGHN